MTILSAKAVRRSYGLREVLKGASFSLDAGERIGFVGRNGSGKSTLARIVAEQETPDEGEVVRRSGLTVGYLQQEPTFESNETAVEAVLSGLSAWREAMATHDESTRAIADGTGDLSVLLDRQAAAGARVEELGGWDLSHEALSLLGQLGVDDPDRDVAHMSGGERRRVAIARLLVAQPELAILDEPTNHLDLETVAWLERWLIDRFRGALVLVTHDRYLLDNVVTRTIEVSEGVLHAYQGGWSQYLEAKAEREAHADRVDANRRNFLRRELEWLRRSPKARSTKQKARVQRVESVRDHSGPKREQRAAIELSHSRSGRIIIEAEDLAVDMGGRRLVSDFSLRLSKGERLGIIGPNGCGKTSLLRVLMRDAEPAAGSIRYGKNTQVAHLDQLRSGLDDEASVYDNVAEGRGVVALGDQQVEVRSYLERFLFRSEEQRQVVGTLSGGERARVALARTLRRGANVVVLDEPTNDLDVDTLGALEESLLDYPGTVLMVTHDRWFLDRVATGLLVFEEGRVVREEGGWADYLARRGPKRERKTAAPSAKKNATAVTPSPHQEGAEARRLTYAERLELEGLEARVETADAAVRDMEATLADPEFYARHATAQREFLATLESARAEAALLADRWAELEERRELG